MTARIDEPVAHFPSELVLVGADCDDALQGAIRRVAEFLSAAPGVPLEDVAYTCALESAGKPCVLAVVADSCAGLRDRLRTAEARIAAGAARVRDKSGMYYTRERLAGPGREGRVAFLFPGTASFYPDMLRDLAILFPACRRMFDELEEALSGKTGLSPAGFIFPPAGGRAAAFESFPGGGYAHAMTATYAADMALVRIFNELGVKPDGVAGFAGGDVSALAAAGVTGAVRRADRLAFLADAYELAARLIEREGLPACTSMLAQAPDAGTLAAAMRAAGEGEKCAIVFTYSPGECVVAARAEAAEEIARILAAHGVRTMRLPGQSPFNTPWCAKAVSTFRKFAARWTRSAPEVPVYSCADAAPLPDGLRAMRRKSVDFWTQPVRFDATILRMHDDGFRVFLELGPRGSLTAAADEILRGRPHAAIAANRVHRSGLLQLHHALAQLASAGVPVDATALHKERRRRKLDFDSPLFAFARGDAEMRLSREFPRLALFSLDPGLSPQATPQKAGKAAMRAAAVAARERKRRQFDFGASDPLVSDGDVVSHTPGVNIEISKEIDIAAAPFISDCAFGTSQLSYSEPSLRGLTVLPLMAGCEMMGELARQLVPAKTLSRIDDLAAHRAVIFKSGRVKLFVRAERAPSPAPGCAAVKVQLRDDSADSSYTWPVMEAVFVFAAQPPDPRPSLPPPLQRPRSVHWTDREIYPARLRYNGLLRAVRRADQWSETGLNYEVRVPQQAGAVSHTRFPLWVANPLLLEAIISGFDLWRSHPRFAGSFAAPFRVRRISLYTPSPAEGSVMKCYLRLASVTPRSHIANITVSDGNGNLAAEIEGLEELTERVPEEYPELILSPATTFLTREIPAESLGDGAAAFPLGSAMVAKVPYGIFERHGEIWLRMVSSAVLCPAERMEFAQLTGTVSRRAEWLFGRIAAKDAVRRFLAAHYQARWACADVQIWPDDSGKPHALGAWSDQLPAAPDISIAHTSRLVVAAAAANARIGLDVEAQGRDLSDEFTRGVFSGDELELAAAAATAPDMTLRFWCAKEAVSKALGTGIRFSPKELNVVSADPASGALAVRLSGGWLAAFKNFSGRDIPVSTALAEDHVLAACFLPSALFGDE